MDYRKFNPTVTLQPFVECYFEWTGLAEKEMDIQSPPSTFSAIVFNFNEPYRAYQHDTLPAQVPKAFVCGLFTSNYHLLVEGPIGMMGIVFKSTALHNFFGAPMSSLVNNRMDLNLLLQEKAPPLIQSMTEASDTAARIKILEAFLLELVPKARLKLNIVDDAVCFIDEKSGRVTVEEVAERFHISKRYLEKKFLEKVGVSPKFYARLKRFSTMANRAVHSEKIDWQGLIHETGLHDQSHLAKEYLEFNKMSPGEYQKHHQELIRYIGDKKKPKAKPE